MEELAYSSREIIKLADEYGISGTESFRKEDFWMHFTRGRVARRKTLLKESPTSYRQPYR